MLVEISVVRVPVFECVVHEVVFILTVNILDLATVDITSIFLRTDIVDQDDQDGVRNHEHKDGERHHDRLLDSTSDCCDVEVLPYDVCRHWRFDEAEAMAFP